MNLSSIKDRVESMNKNNQIEIGRILINEHSVSYTENQNGTFINLSNITEEIAIKLRNYINYVDLQESQINQTEHHKDELKDIYFNKIE